MAGRSILTARITRGTGAASGIHGWKFSVEYPGGIASAVLTVVKCEASLPERVPSRFDAPFAAQREGTRLIPDRTNSEERAMSSHRRIRPVLAMGPFLAIGVVAITLGFARLAQADGYDYVPKSYYVAPPLMYDFYFSPIFFPAPIIMYEPIPGPPPPVVGHYYPRPGRVGRARESWNSSPRRTRYRYEYEFPNGVEYKYRYKRDGNFARYRETWDD
jgi:hypothetical protein